MGDVRDLYRAAIVEHSRQPRNLGRLAAATHHARGYNPLCGDEVDVYLELRDDVLAEISFEVSGCAICIASASLMSEHLKSATVAVAQAVSDRVHETTGVTPSSDEHLVKQAGSGNSVELGDANESSELVARAELGELAVLEGVRSYPLRAKCATLPWQTLCNALEAKTGEAEVPI